MDHAQDFEGVEDVVRLREMVGYLVQSVGMKDGKGAEMVLEVVSEVVAVMIVDSAGIVDFVGTDFDLTGSFVFVVQNFDFAGKVDSDLGEIVDSDFVEIADSAVEIVVVDTAGCEFEAEMTGFEQSFVEIVVVVEIGVEADALIDSRWDLIQTGHEVVKEQDVEKGYVEHDLVTEIAVTEVLGCVAQNYQLKSVDFLLEDY